MIKQSLQESYTQFLKNQITKAQFQNIMYRNTHAKRFVSPANSLEDSIKILKVKKILSENFTPGMGDQTNEPLQEISRINQPGYQFYIFSVSQGKIVAGNEFREDALEAGKNLSHLGQLKLVTPKTLKTKYHIDPNDNGSWGTDQLPDADGNDELSEEAGVSDKISADIDSMLNEFRKQVEEGWQEKLPDDYDDDMKGAGLGEAEGTSLTELSPTTVRSASNKMVDKGQHQRALNLTMGWEKKLVDRQVGSLWIISAARLESAGLTIRLVSSRNNNFSFFFTYIEQHDVWDSRDDSFPGFDRAGAKAMGKIASLMNPETKYLKSYADLKIAGY